MTLVWFLAGLAALVVGAELLVRGASRLALAWGLSPLVVGLTVVAFGTSAPETAVSVGAVFSGRTDIAVGNVVGSNIFNVLFILGVSALIVPLTVARQVIRQEVPIMIGASVLLLALGLDGTLSRLDGLWLVGLLIAYTAALVIQSRREAAAQAPSEDSSAGPAGGHWAVQLLLVIGGLALLVLGSRWLVDAAVTMAQALGVSDLVIGLTVVAAGTSLPEVATSVMAAVRGQRDIAVGNVVGSCTFNLLGCLGLSALLGPQGLTVAASLLHFDIWVMIAVAFACLPFFFTGRQIARWEGAVFLAYYAAYTAYLVLRAQHHDALPAFSHMMLGFVLPLTLITIVVSVIRPSARQAPPAG